MAKKISGVSARKKPLQERAKFTVDAILKATTQLLDKNVESVTTNGIAQLAGVSIGSLYQYFPNKDAILERLLEQFTDGHLSMIEQTLVRARDKNHSLEDTARTIIHAIIESNRKNSRLAKIFVTTLFRPERIKLLQKMDEKMIAKFKQFFEPYKDEVDASNLDMKLFIVIQSVRSATVSVLFHSKYQITDPALEDELVRLTLGLLRKRP
ncbi:MAG: hypothetical protein CME71_08845 [Halobacteriovorax sp.]|nr:hypothetical protein [Halobacteriovorax sp.]